MPSLPQKSAAARRINELSKALQAERYLEIGVLVGNTFLNVEMNHKVAVDTHFQFDYHAFENEGTSFCQATSDEYFSIHNAGEKFDIIYLDGLHTFEQTFRDFLSTLLCSHEKTVWILDDTVPSDVYSTCPTQMEAHTLRKNKGGGDNMVWQGDIFKMAFAVHDFFPMLSYATVTEMHTPQTVVWRSPRKDFKPHFNSMNTLASLTYLDFLRYPNLMNYATDENTLACILEAFSAQIEIKTA